MAAEPTRIKLKRSTTATVVPTTSNLADGEVAVNIADRKIYVRNGGSIVEVANQKPNTGEVTTAMLATDITNGPGNSYYVSTVGSNTSLLGSGGDNGKHPDTPFLTVAKALSVATAGDTVNIAAGTYQEVFPLTVPDGVTLRGANLRSTQITPTPATNDLNAFILQGDSHVSDLTVKDFFYNSGNDTGYGFVCASSLDSDRSPYIERVSVLTKGSVTSASDPYGFAQGDAGRGAKLDGAQFSSNSIEAAILFNEVTFIVPNSVGLLLTNGVRVEWLNSFVYFAAEGIKGEQGATGRAGAGQTRLKLSGVSGTFSAAEVIYQLEDSFQSGTYSRTGTTVTITKTAHGLVDGDVINADFISGTATDGYYTVANSAANTFDVTDTASGTTSGNITFKKADAYGTITTNDGTYLLINGKGVGEFTTGVPTGKTGVIAGDAQLDTAQQKFGTASLLLDGVTDHLSYPTSEDFGFGTTNFAFECFIRPTATTGTQYFLDFRDGSDTDTAPTMYLDGTTLHFGVGNTSQISGGTVSAGTWYHVAAARFGGTTRLFLDGTQLGTYTDSNDYGATKPLGIGGEYGGSNEFGGHIDEVRVSKASARYTGAFTAPTAAFTTDLFTVLLLHFDGTDGSTTITDSGKGVRDIRSSGGDSATSLLTADYAQFGAELRSIASANIYGTKGAIADGAGVKLLLTGHNFAYIGSGADFTNDPDLAIPANEVTETNGGRIFYSATNEKGDFRIGDAFVVDQQTGNVQFQSTSTAQEAANITLSDPTGTTRIFPAFVETGNLRLSGNTLSSTSGNVIIDPSANEDILLNAEVIAPEKVFFDNTKLSNLELGPNGGVVTKISGITQSGTSSFGLFSNKNVTIFTSALSTVLLDDEGSQYAAGSYLIDAVTNPDVTATATATLQSLGSVKEITVTASGSGYTLDPIVTIAGGGTATATVTRKLYGGIHSATILTPGSGYTSAPTLTGPPPGSGTFGVFTDVDSATDTITSTGHPFNDNDPVVYSVSGGSDNIGLTDGVTYYVKDATTNTFKLSATPGGGTLNLTSVNLSIEIHTLTGVRAEATATISAGSVNSVTITNVGSGYSAGGSLNFSVSGGGGLGADISAFVGTPIDLITVDSNGSGYASAPAVTITASGGDTTGAGATATSSLGYLIDTLTLTGSGSGYSVNPNVILSGGNPDIPATAETVLDKQTGIIDSISLTFAGNLYETAPTVTIDGGGGSEATISLEILPLGGNILSAGSGYVPGTYTSVPFTGGSAAVAATATIVVPGFVGTITGGSNYVDGTYTSVTLKNNPTTTYTVTTSPREVINFRYTDNDLYEWNVVDDGNNTAFDFTRVSATGTPSGSNISISCEVGDLLTINVNAPGHPFYVQTVSGAFSSANLVGGDIQGNGTDNGSVIWDTKDVAPGVYYYVCGVHQAMAGSITITAYTGTSFQVGNTIVGANSGANAVVTYIGPGFFRASSVTSGPFQTGETLSNGSVTATSDSTLAQQSVTTFLLDGSESPSLSLSSYNTYKFDISDSSNQNASFTLSGFTVGEIVNTIVGGAGLPGGYYEVVVKNTATPSTKTVRYGSFNTGNYVTIVDGVGSQGVYGEGLIGTVTVESGSVSSVSITNQGSNYKVTDVLIANPSDLSSPSGVGFNFTLSGNNTGVSEVKDISTTGGIYQPADVLSIDPTFDGSGGGGGFQFNVTKAGFVNSATVATGGFSYFAGQTLVPLAVAVSSGAVDAPTTSGNAFALSVDTVDVTEVLEFGYDGSITNSTTWSIDRDGNTDLSGGTLLSGDITASEVSGTIFTASTSATTPALTVTSSATIDNLTATGDNEISSALVSLRDGTSAVPSLKFANSDTTGFYRDSADVIGISTNAVPRIKIGTTDVEITNNLRVDSAYGAATPFFSVDPTAETVDIGAPTTGIRINNDASIQSIGSDADVDITINPKGTGNLILTGGVDKDFSITDGSTEVFKVDTDSGNTEISGRVDIDSNIRIRDNIISSDIAQNAITSFGQIITVSATGTATGYTDNTYTGVISTSDRSGTGATFDVTVSGGDITSIAINAGGAGYAEGELITLDTATIGSGSGKTITVTDIEGAGLVLKPSVGKNVKVDSTAMFVVPAGSTNQRPPAGDRQIGGIRFNSEQQQFEGYNGTDFVSLGGVRDVNQDTYILTELAPGTNEDTFFFFNQGVNSLDIVQDKFKLYTAKTFDTSGTLTLNGVTVGSAALDVRSLNTSILTVRAQKDVEVTGGLRFKSVPTLGEIATIGSITSTAAAYTPSATLTNIASVGQFEGSGATFDVTIDGAGSISSIVVNTAGSGFEVNEVVTILGTLLGGLTPDNDVTFPVATIANTQSPFTRLDILQQDYVTQLDGKPFLTLDANGAEAAWKINRGWNGGTESYLTVFDSTATFMELDDCRLEGGQLSSFGASSTIVQFNKTSFKGAKTLVTIESDDGKVHMLEVTSICAASGTTAYATITNSVTSANDLVDADVVVVGNNVQVNLTKSAAATSSTSFTGRFTTTKVKV